MTTTANLSVGIDTSAAFESLRKLRAEMQAQPHNLVISVDAKSVDRDIERYLKQRTFKISINTKALGAEIANDVGIALDRAFERSDRKLGWNQAALRGGMNAAIDGVFNDKDRRLRYDRERLQADLRASVEGALSYTHHIAIDKAALAAQVRQAVALGSAGATLQVGGVAAASAPTAASPASGLPDGLRNVIRETLLPAVDRMVVAADTIASVARRTSVGGTVGTAKATRSISAKGTDGFTTRFSQTLDNPEMQVAGIQVANFDKNADALDLLNQAGQRQQQIKRMRAQAAAEELNEAGLRAQQFRQLRAQQRGEELNDAGQRAADLKRMRAQEAGDELNEIGQRAAQLRQRRNQTKAEELNEAGQRAADLKRLRAQAAGDMLNEVGQRAEQFRQRRAQGRLNELNEAGQRAADLKRMRAQDAGEELNALGERAEMLRKRRMQMRMDELNDVGQRAAEIKKRKAQASFDEQGWSYGPDRATLDAGAASRRARDSKAEIDSHRQNLKALTGTMNEAHSAARGLASGFGAMWLTWGNLAPLLAGAAISHSFVQSLKDGMAVSQELATIKYMGGESAGAVSALNAALLNTQNNGPFGPREVSVALKTLSLAGLDAKQQLQALQAVMNFSIAGQVSLEKSAEVLVAVSTAYGYTAKDFNVVGDIVTKAAASSMASVDSMSESFKSASVVAQQYKVSLEDTAITISLLSQVGIKGSAAGTSMRQMYSELSGASKKARDILQNTLKVDVLDNFTGGMRPLVSIITELSVALDKFGPKAQQRILQDMGNERGTKALAANLSAFRTELDKTGRSATNELLRMQQMMQDAPGFMAEAAVGMSLTAQNQMKAVGSSLEGTLVKAFQAIEPSVLQVSMQLREMFSSSGFQGGVKNAVTLVSNFTSTVINHAGFILEVVKAYAAWKVVTLSFGGLSALSTLVTTLGAGYMRLGAQATVAAIGTTGINAALALAPAATTAAAAGFLRLQAAMGWISIIGTVLAAGVTAWMLYKEKSVDASVSKGEAAAVAAKVTMDAMESEIASLTKTIEMRRQGVKEELIAQETAANVALENIHSKNEETRAILKATHATNLYNQAKLHDKIGSTPYAQTGQGANALKQVDDAVLASRATLANSYFDESVQDAKFEAKRRELRNLARQNAQEATEAAAARQTHKSGDQEFAGIDRKADRTAHNAVMAAIEDRKTAYDIDVRNVEARYKTEDVLLKARQSAGLISTEEYEQRLNLLAERHSKERVDLANKEYEDIKAIAAKATATDVGKAKNKQSLSDADRSKIDRDLAEAKSKASLAAADEANRAAVAAIALEGALKKAAENGKELQMKHAVEDMKALRDMALSLENFQIGSNRGAGAQTQQSLYGSQYIGGMSTSGMSEAQKEALRLQKEETRRDNYQRGLEGKYNADASLKGGAAKDTTMKAALAAYDSYASDLVSLEAKLERNQTLLDDINKRRGALANDLDTNSTTNVEKTKADLSALSESAINLSQNIKGIRAEIDVVEAMRDNSVNVRSEAARKLYEYERSAEAGMLSFWKQYREEATNTARLVDNALSQTFSSMEQGLLKFVTTGKLNFKEFTRSILADVARMMANAALRQFLGMALNFVVSGFGSAGGGGTGVNGSAGTGTGGSGGGDTYFAAHGGVISEYGALPLRKFAKGGIAHGPVASIHGEGSLPEANVPLQDGRTIPVTITQPAGGGEVNVNIQVNIDSNGKSQVESDTSGNKAGQLGQMIDTAVMQVIVREKRPGGILYS